MSKEGKIQIDINGEIYDTTLSDNYLDNQKYKIPEKTTLRALIPGMIVEIKVEVGDKVKPGAPVIVLEAMKMLNQIELEETSIIEEILIKEGDIVEKDQDLIKFKIV